MLEIEMKIRVSIIVFWIVMAVMGSCKPPQASPRPSPEGEGEACRTLEEIDSLMWKRADSAFAMLQAFVVGPMADSLDEFEEHYCQLLISELLYKNDYGQSNREDLLKAVDYFDSLTVGKRETDTRRVSLRERNSFLEARAHYINGVGFYELGDVVNACAEYLKTLEVMEECFNEQELVGHKARFLAYTYNRLGDLFEELLLAEPAITCYKQALFYCRRETTSKYGIPVLLYRLGIQYDIIGQKDSAAFFYDEALANMPDCNNLHYRDLMANKILFAYYNFDFSSDSLIKGMKQLVTLSTDEGEKTTRLLTLGNVLFEEKQYDSSRMCLETVFEQQEDITSKIMAAENLCNIYQTEGDSVKAQKYASFLVGFTMSEIEKKTDVSKANEMFNDYLTQKQEKRSEIERKKAVKNNTNTIIPVAITIALAIICILIWRSKKLLKNQQAEADKVLEETEQRLKEVERKHQQWMAEAKERHAEELLAQRDRSKKEIEQTKERHAKELEEEREAYQKEREALRQILQSKEEQVRDLEMTLSQQQEEIVRRREAFLKEPVCKRINDLLHGRHITTRDTSYQHDDITLKEKDFKQLKEAVERHFEGFDAALSGRCPSLKHNDLTLCHLYLMGLSEGEIAALRSRTYSGIKKQNESLQEKLGLDEGVAGYVLRVAEELCGTPTRNILQNSSLKGTLKSTWSNTLKGTQKKIVEIIINNPNVTIPQVAEQLDLNPRGIAKHFKALQEKGVIRRIGPDKGGHWEVMG